ncbi:MAG TPA: hypothetical protein V6D18_09210 [Thermosynechococcaceae cyanobacterium]
MFPRSDGSVPRSFPQPLDRVALLWMAVLSLLIVVLLWSGNHTAPRVRGFSWQDKQVGSEDAAFILTFSRPMDQASVEKNLQVKPPLPGKMSWAGRRMAYTLNTPAPYGNKFEVVLQDANDRFRQGSTLQGFKAQFSSRDRAFTYIGVEGEEAGRLILYNVTQDKKQVLTPPELAVTEFEPYPMGDRVLFAATERSNRSQGLLEQKLYTVSTGIRVKAPTQLDAQGADSTAFGQPIGKVELVLDSTDYQNLKFDLSPNGQIIVVQRVSRKDPADFGPWILRAGDKPQPLKGEPGGDFLITSDSSSLAIAQGQGLAILPLQPDAKPLNFLPKFGTVLSFSKDGTQATMLKFNTDRTRSLFLVDTQGAQKELFRTTGSILSAQFDPTRRVLYCLLTELQTGGELYQEQPYLAAIDLKTSQLFPLAILPIQPDIQVSLSPDGLAILLDQTTQKKAETSEKLRNSTGKAIASSRLWLLPLNPETPTAKTQPVDLPIAGLRPRWLP